MVGRRLISLFVALLIGAVLWTNGAVAGPNLPPAPFKPLANSVSFIVESFAVLGEAERCGVSTW